MDKKGKSVIIFGLIAMLALIIFAVIGFAHINPQGKQTHQVGIETKSCQDALAGAEEQFQDRGKVNPRLIANIEDKCGVEDCRIDYDADHEPVLICGECSIEFGEWTQWFDRDDPSGTGDWETLNALRIANPGEICDNPTQIKCQTLDGADYTETGQDVICSVDTGLICLNSENDEGCEDYKIRVYCESTLVCDEEVPQCVEISQEEIHFGACTLLDDIVKLNIPQCCTTETPSGINCGEDQEWVVGFAASPGCFILNS